MKNSLIKYNYFRKSSLLSFSRKFLLYIQSYFRNILSMKKYLLILIIFFSIIFILFLHQKNQFCDPTEHLWWFCSWPDQQETVCPWDQHFPALNEKIRSPESYNELFLSLPKVRPLFEYNNKTFIRCPEQSLDLVIFIISKCSHFSIRQSIRRTWANIELLEEYFPKLKLKLLFLVDIDSKSEKKIELEYIYHKDIVQINNLGEQYEYVTEREAALYQFIQFYCKQTKFLFKTDDDIFINSFLLLLFINKQIYSFNQYSLFGFPMEHSLVVRHTESFVGQRYIITKDEYSCPRYPTFLSGFGYLMSFQTLSLFSNAYFIDRKPFPLSDVYFTGLLSEMFHIKRETMFENVNYRYETTCNQQFFTGEINPFACAASDDHFNRKESGGDRSLMNDYNLYWTKLTEKYDSLRINAQK